MWTYILIWAFLLVVSVFCSIQAEKSNTDVWIGPLFVEWLIWSVMSIGLMVMFLG